MASEPPAGAARRTAAKVLRVAGIGGGVLLVLVAAGAAFVSSRGFGATVEAWLTTAMLEGKRRTLSFGQPLEFSFWPSAGFVSGPVALSEPDSDAEFASVAAARCSIAVTPLLAGRIAVDRCEVEGLRAEIVRRRDGMLNIDDLLGPRDASASDAEIDAAELAIRGAALAWRDEAAGTRFAAGDIEFSGTGVKADTGAKTLRADRLSLSGRSGDVRLRLDLGGLDVSQQAATAQRAGLDLRYAAGKTAVGVALDSPLAVDLAGGRLALDKLEGACDLVHPRLARPLTLSLRGSLHAGRQSADANLAAGFAGTKAAVRLDLIRYSPLSLRFDAEVDRLDLDRHLAAADADADAKQAAPGRPTGFAGLDIVGSARIGSLQVAGVTTSNLRLEIRAADGRVEMLGRRAARKP